jgi:hypothetical protein
MLIAGKNLDNSAIFLEKVDSLASLGLGFTVVNFGEGDLPPPPFF